MTLTLLGAALVFLTQCKDHDWQSAALDAPSSCPTRESNAYFFPPGALALPGRKDDEFARTWYSKHLAAMEEPSLSCGPPTADVSYRFLWLPTWGPPVSVRVTRTENRMQIDAVELSGAGGYEPGTVARRQSTTLAFTDWERIERALSAARFWNAPTTVDRFGADGTEWIAEGRLAQRYHVVDRWASRPNDAFHALGLVFLDVAGWSSSEAPVQ